MVKDKLVPKRRFKEFKNDEAWEQRKVKDVCSISTGKSNTQDRIDDGIYPFYVRSPIIEHSSKYLYDEEAVLTVGDGVGTGKVFHYVNGKYDLHQRVYRMFNFINDISGKYFYYFFSNYFYDRVMSMTAKTSVDSVRFEMISEMDILLPGIEEQAKIIDFFDSLNNLITLHQRKLEKLKELKLAYLSEMFPEKGEKYPKRRFAGFTDPWEQRKLSDFAYKAVDNRGKTPPLDSNGTHPLIEVASLGTGSPNYSKVEKYLNNYSFEHHLRDHIKKGDILFSTVGSIGLVSLMDDQENAAIAQNIVAFRAKENYSSEYLYALFSTKSNKTKAYRIIMGAVQPSIKVSQLVDVEYFITNDKKEQELIGKFFLQLDNLITLHQRKLEKLENIKKAYLNEMFV